MFPTMERRRARSTYSSVSWLPSCTARRVSVTPSFTTIRFPTAAPDGPGVLRPARLFGLLELPHSNREEEPQSHEGHHHGRPPIAHERERNADHGQEAGHHPQVDQGLGGEQRGDAQGDDTSPRLACARGDLEPPE